MILLVVAEWVLTIIIQKIITIARHYISDIYRTCKCWYFSFIKIGIFELYYFFYNVIPWSIPSEWWAYILCIIAIDFLILVHRLTHVNRFGGATHVTHHNSEKYNLSVAFRLGWTQHIKFIFFIPVILMGFDPVIFLYVTKKYYTNFGFILNILGNYRLQ
jgi:sterol desaturase/sphingolipid hydroxylase (fatty acid hydroxylase superfamily)